MSDYAARIAALQTYLRAQGCSLAVLAGTEQMRYLTGWREGGHERFVGLFVPANGEPAFLVPKMNAPQAAQTPAGLSSVLGWDDGPGWMPHFRTLLHDYGLDDGNYNVLVDGEMWAEHLLAIQDRFPGLSYRSATAAMASLRERKTPAELAAMQTAADLIDAVFEETAANLREGMTELDVADFVLARIKAHGSTPSFSPLICFGANAALPHHHTGDAKLKPGDIVIIDIGSTSENYASDITRTVSFGPPSDPDAVAVYRIVHNAHWAARDYGKPGVSCESVDAAARAVIAEAGYGDFFVHRTGHGIGLQCHEPPNIVAGNTQILAPGMCFSVEPGIYLPGRFGIRIENIVTVTETGLRSLNVDTAPELRVV